MKVALHSDDKADTSQTSCLTCHGLLLCGGLQLRLPCRLHVPAGTVRAVGPVLPAGGHVGG